MKKSYLRLALTAVLALALGCPPAPCFGPIPADADKSSEQSAAPRDLSSLMRAEPPSGPAPLHVTFSLDTQIAPGQNLTWDFGTGGTTLAHTPRHGFEEPGTHPVKVALTDADGTLLGQGQRDIEVTRPPLEPRFKALPTTGTAPLEVRFEDNTVCAAGELLSRQWHFGDGHSSHRKNPTHRYKQPGAYAVSLTVEDAFGKRQCVKKGLVRVLPPVDEHVMDARGRIGPEGGSLGLADGTLLEIPEGALAEETPIRLGLVRGGIDGQGTRYVKLEPEGLELAKPASLFLPYDPERVADPELVQASAYSKSADVDLLDPDAEKSAPLWQPILITAGAAVGGAVLFEAALAVFKLILVTYSEPVYVVPYLPGEYLQPGDLCIVMAQKTIHGPGELSWDPGHTAMYLGTKELDLDLGGSYENNGYTIIESVPSGIYIRNWFDPWNPYGYQRVRYHLYMGARRYDGVISDPVMEAICEFAISHEDDEYDMFAQGNFTDEYFSCSGLVEAAYDSQGKGIIPDILELPFIFPKEHYDRTVPVDTIRVTMPRAGADPLDVAFPVYGVRFAERVDFRPRYENMSVTAYGFVDGMSLEDDEFHFTPERAGRYAVTFHARNNIKGRIHKAEQTITIHVDSR